MGKRTIALNRCLCQQAGADCQKCRDVCPRDAIQAHEVLEDRCDDCGLCTAVCPTGAICSEVDYDRALERVVHLTPPVLMCRNIDPDGMICLGAINGRLLWGLAAVQPLSIDISRCASCKPEVFRHLTQEISDCNDALRAEKREPVRCVRVRGIPAEDRQPVTRRRFFSSFFSAAAEGLREISETSARPLYAFDPVNWLTRRNAPAGPVFPDLYIRSFCSGCGLCAAVCPEHALVIRRQESGSVDSSFDPVRCTGCGLCQQKCPLGAIELHRPVINGGKRVSERKEAER